MIDPKALFDIPVTLEPTPDLDLTTFSADRVPFIGQTTYTNPDAALLAAAHGVDCAGNSRQVGVALQARKDIAQAVLFSGYQSARFQNFDWRLAYYGLMTNLFTVSDPFFMAAGPEGFWGLSFDDYLLAASKGRPAHTV